MLGMNRTHWIWLTTLGLLGAFSVGGCASGPPSGSTTPDETPAAPPTAAPKAAQARSYSLEMPERWKRVEADGHELITGPEGLVTLKIIEAPGGELGAAVDRAWAKASPAMKLKERSRNEGSPNDRFEKQLVVTYTDDKNDHVAQAIALLHKDGKRVYVLLIEGPLKEAQKRGAELNRIIGSIEVTGAKRVEVTAADAKPLDDGRREELFGFVEGIRKREFTPSPGKVCERCDVMLVCPYSTFDPSDRDPRKWWQIGRRRRS